jgi:hypothetical protein
VPEIGPSGLMSGNKKQDGFSLHRACPRLYSIDTQHPRLTPYDEGKSFSTASTVSTIHHSGVSYFASAAQFIRQTTAMRFMILLFSTFKPAPA